MDPTLAAGNGAGAATANDEIDIETQTEEFFKIFSESIMQDEILEFANED